jgi:RNA polymerase sigma-70 factor, ECF subfamily
MGNIVTSLPKKPISTRDESAVTASVIGQEALLVARAQRGDKAATDQLLRGVQDVLYRFCLSTLCDAEAARDATQETAVRVLRGLSSFSRQSSFQTWALGIAVNVSREMRRRQAQAEKGARDIRTTHATRSTESPQPDTAADEREQMERLAELMNELTDRQREALVLRFFEEQSVEQTAGVMGCASGTVKATVSQAIRILRQRWSKP